MNAPPVFTTSKDTVAERELSGRVSRAWGVKVHEQPPGSPVDRFLYERDGVGVLHGLVELKCRKCHSLDFPDIIVNAHKLMTLVQWARTFDLPAFVVASYSDGDRWARVDDRQQFVVHWGQRPGEPWKPIAHVPKLLPLGTKPSCLT